MRTVERELVVKLTEDQINEFSKELARLTTAQAGLEEEKKTAVSSFKEKIDRCVMEMRSLARKISSRQDFRQVSCLWEFDYDTQTARLIRQDTFVEVERRKMSQDELQGELGFE